MRRNARPQPRTLAFAISLALATPSVAHAVDYTIDTGITYPFYLLNSNTLNVTGSGSISTSGFDAVSVESGASTTIANAGSITSTASSIPDAGIFNTGTITTLTNTGSITGGSFGIYNNDNGGIITTLTNTGSITGGSYGIYNRGTITALTNTSSITGGFGVRNNGTITTLTNSGTITGTNNEGHGISNNGTITTLINTGSITGGSAGIYNSGTLTTLINGQTTPLIYNGSTGNYYTYFNTPSSYGKVSFLNQGGDTLPNYGLRIADGQNYAVGTYTDVITSSGPLTISAYEAVSGVTYHLATADGGLNWNLVIDSVSSSRVFDGASALANTPAYNAARVIDANLNLLALFAPLTTNGQLSSAASQTMPVFTGNGQLVARATLDSVNRLINERIAGNLGLASGDSFYGDKHVWMRPFGSVAEQDARSGVAGYKANSYGLVTGVDGSLNGDALRLGAAFAYARSDVNGQDSTAPHSGNIDVYQLIGYGSYRLDDRTAVSFQVDVGQNANDTRRAILFAGTTAAADYNSWTSHLGAGVGRTYALSAGTTLTPTLRADYTWIKDDSYSETGDPLLSQNVNSRSSEAFVVGIDGKLVHTLNDRTSLLADLGVGYDTINDTVSITSAFAGAPGAAFTTTGIKPSPWVGRAAVGVEYKAQDGLSIVGRYDAERRTSFLNQTASLNLRKAF